MTQVYNFDVVILGGGPAGLSSAMYAARGNVSTAVIDINPFGGQPSNYMVLENYPGSINSGGFELMETFEQQADLFGVKKFPMQEILSIDLISDPKVILTTEARFNAKTVILATGAQAKKLGVKGEEEFTGRGVSYCAVCDGALYRGQDVAVVGGGDTAIEEALHLAKMCKSVKLIHRRDQLRASKPMQKKLSESTIEVIWDSVVEEVLGENFVTGLKLKNVKTNEESVINVGAVFMAIGHAPATEMFEGQLDRDKDGYFITNGTPATKVPGVYVAGDCGDRIFRQAITSAGTGCQAALLAERYLMENK